MASTSRRGLRGSPSPAVSLTLMRVGWGKENPAFRQLFTSQFMPGGTKQQADWFNELQRITVSADVAARAFEASGDTDVTALLPRVTVPTLVRRHVRPRTATGCRP
jgi:hypothetical protein